MIITIGGIEYDLEARTATVGGEARPFTSEEEALVSEAEAVTFVAPDALMTAEAAAWNDLVSPNPLTTDLGA